MSHIARFAAYHSQKENMTWAAATLYVLATAVLVGLGSAPFWRDAPWWTFWSFFVVLGLTSTVAFFFVSAQFQRRDAAHWLVQACSNLSAQWLVAGPTSADLEPLDLGKHGFGTSHDQQLFPAAVVREVARLKQEQAARKVRNASDRLTDRVLTLSIMAAWTVAALAKVLLAWSPSISGYLGAA